MSNPWWREAAGYQVYLRSFADSDGDGCGDLPGVRDRLPYLVELGVDALWLAPFYPSPQADHGYDITDQRAVDPIFGTLSDVDGLLDDVHRCGLRVLVDVVPNHTSAAHPWFRAALAAPRGGPERARYHFRQGRVGGPPNRWTSMFGGSAWTPVDDGDWYLHLFSPEQPDLNWANPQVRDDFVATLRFWLDRGIDGVRIDVAGGMAKDPDYADVVAGADVHPHWDRPELEDLHRQWRQVLDGYRGDRVAIGELWGSPARIASRVAPGQLHQVFQFDWAVAPWSAAELRRTASAALTELGRVGALPTWVLGSHDLTRPVSRYGGGDQGLRRARAKALVTFALPGAAWIYQGEELGLSNAELPDEALRDPTWERSGHTDRGRDGVRVPLPWTGESPSFGFTSAPHAWLPQPDDWGPLSVLSQREDTASTLEMYRSALRLRKQWLVSQPFEWLPAQPGLLAFRRGRVVCLLNTGSRGVRPPITGVPLITSAGWDGDGRLPPDASAWLLND